MKFYSTFRAALAQSGEQVTFTKSEARALAFLSKNSDVIISRQSLLDAVTQPGSERNDRSIDFLINRLRRKLDDDARNPRFIETRYGEGYIWIGPKQNVAQDLAGIDIVVGPVRGVEIPLQSGATVLEFAQSLYTALKKKSEPEHKVALVPDFDINLIKNDNGPEISVEMTLVSDGAARECIIVARSLRTGQILEFSRHRFDLGLPISRADSGYLIALAEAIVAKLWEVRAKATISSQPLPVAMHDAALRPQSEGTSWDLADQRLRILRASSPENPELKLMYATHLHSKYILKGQKLFFKNLATCSVDEAEIEKLVLESLSFAQSNPDYAVIAGKLLYFVNRGYRDLALELVETAHRSDVNIASSLVVIGQLKGFLGQTGNAIEALEQSVSLSKPGTEFHVYCLVLLCQTLLAHDRRDELVVARGKLYKQSVLGAVFFELLFSDPEAPSLRAKASAMMLSRGRAKALLEYFCYISTRLFEQEVHRENSIRLPVILLQKRFGSSIIPEALAPLVPRLIR